MLLLKGSNRLNSPVIMLTLMAAIPSLWGDCGSTRQTSPASICLDCGSYLDIEIGHIAPL